MLALAAVVWKSGSQNTEKRKTFSFSIVNALGSLARRMAVKLLINPRSVIDARSSSFTLEQSVRVCRTDYPFTRPVEEMFNV